ncbi:hypothetical protein L1987_57611 [Smallanthus sonchifolius]|uniref:Uncharacterized protein n=1 Tax=Smallanthus sonchifolius TaxID=185202 RepID=A0ACB9DDS1_9ASTR|nr:hypothetical protein L1987_57611 [Smallanthus sonchifolius]
MACSDRQEGQEKGRCGGRRITGECSGGARVSMNASGGAKAAVVSDSLEEMKFGFFFLLAVASSLTVVDARNLDDVDNYGDVILKITMDNWNRGLQSVPASSAPTDLSSEQYNNLRQLLQQNSGVQGGVPTVQSLSFANFADLQKSHLPHNTKTTIFYQISHTNIRKHSKTKASIFHLQVSFLIPFFNKLSLHAPFSANFHNNITREDKKKEYLPHNTKTTSFNQISHTNIRKHSKTKASIFHLQDLAYFEAK